MKIKKSHQSLAMSAVFVSMVFASMSLAVTPTSSDAVRKQVVEQFTATRGSLAANLITEMKKAPAKSLEYLISSPTNPAAEATWLGGITPDTIRDSFASPKPLYNKLNMMAGGFDVFHGDIFTEGFFRQHIGQVPNGDVSLSHVVSGQPWFEWSSTEKRHIFRQDGAQEKLISQMGSGTVSLFRGTTRTETNIILAIQFMSRPALKPKARDYVNRMLLSVMDNPRMDEQFKATLASFRDLVNDSSKTALEINNRVPEFKKAYLEFLARIGKSLYFLTPDMEKAKGWSKGTVMQFDIAASELQRLSKKHELYAGIEYDYVEVALGGAEAVNNYLMNAKPKILNLVEKPAAPPVQFAIFNPDEEPATQGTIIIDNPDAIPQGTINAVNPDAP